MKCRSFQTLRLSLVLMLALVSNKSWAREIVCMDRIVGSNMAYRAEAIATRILESAAVHIELKNDVRACARLKSAIVIRVSEETPATEHPGSLAYAMAYEQVHIVVFYDRVLENFPLAGVPSVLGHVLAHEIGHILQGVERHSATGVMKEKWDHRDYVNMQREPLRFTDEDLLLIRQGLKYRA